MKNNFKKLDDEEVIFVNEPWTPEERKSFTEYLKAEKKKRESQKLNRVKPSSVRPKERAAK